MTKVTSVARKDGASSWVNIPNPERKPGEGKVLIQYDTIPASTRAKLPAKNVLLQQLADDNQQQQREAQEQILRGLLPPASAEDLATLREYRITRESVDLGTGEALKNELSGLPDTKLRAAVLACRWLALMSSPRWKSKATRVKLNPDFAKLSDMQMACVAVYSADGVDLPTSYSKVQAKLREYEENGALAVVPRQFGNVNSRKIAEEQLETLIQLYSDARKPSFELVHRWYTEVVDKRRELGLELWPEVTVGTVKNNLMLPDVQPVWYLPRHGFKAWKERYEYTMLRHRPTFRDALWVVDGTKVNYYYRTAKGVAAKLQVIAVIDAHSDYWLGWEFCEQEDSDAVGRALRAALRTAGGVKPWQVQYDNDRSNLKFFANWAGLHFPAMPNNGQSKVIERALGALQQHVMRRHRSFTGQNITATSLAGKANPELLRELVKEGALMSLEETMREASLDFHAWNNMVSKKDGKTPKERYLASQHPETRSYFTEEDEMETFWKWNDQLITYRSDELRMVKSRISNHYEVVTELPGPVPGTMTKVPDLDFHMRNVGQRFWVKYDPEQAAPTRVALFLGEDKRFVAWADNKEAMPGALVDYQEGSRAAINARLAAKKEQRAQTAERLANITERLDAEELVKLGHEFVPKDALNAAQADLEAEDEVQVTINRRPERSNTLVLSPAMAAATETPDAIRQARWARMQQQAEDED
ncbi:hypothetical protein [Hymenobacter glacieicola]|uniref:hypothetical protein n=1 Tax=Hymenobacter glacieicola TaxID=1562124 RepID=UPI00166A8496|nr:hypothetical protein [Hymenobacter glacieicola]